MKESKDQLEQIIKNEYDRLAKEEENDIQEDDTIEVPEGTKESLRAKIDQQIEEMKKKKSVCSVIRKRPESTGTGT